MQVGETRTVTIDEAKAMRKQGWMRRDDIVTMMYVGLPDSSVRSNISIASEKGGEAVRRKTWTSADHAFVNRKLAEAR